MSTQAIILFAHGARDPDWALPFVIIKKQVQAARPNAYVELAFQDFMTPALEAAVGQCRGAGRKARRRGAAVHGAGQPHETGLAAHGGKTARAISRA